MQVVRRVDRARERPLVLLAPGATDKEPSLRGLVRVAAAHHEDTHRRLAVHAVLEALQPAIEPPQTKRVHVQGRRRTELGDPEKLWSLAAMRPRTDNQPLQALLRFRQLDIVEVRDLCAPRVVPAGDVIRRHVLVLGEVIDDARSHAGPEVVVVAVAHGFNQPVLIVRRKFERRGPGPQRQRHRVVPHARAQLLQGRNRRRG